MAEQRIRSKDQLLAEIGRTWRAFNTALEQLTEHQMLTVKDAEGWMAKDHIIHLAVWEQSVLSPLQGQARHEGLGVQKEIYLTGGYDAINDGIYRQHIATSLAEARGWLHDIHHQLLAALQPLTLDDLQQPYRHFLPAETGEVDDRSALELIYANTVHHFSEHLTWMESLVDEGSGRDDAPA